MNMKEYYKISTASEGNLNNYLDKGWEVIETAKFKGEYDEHIVYHIGFPLKKAFELAMKVLKTVDKHDLRLEILERTATEIGEDISNYSPARGSKVDNSLVEILEITDFLMSGIENPRYYKQDENEDIGDDFF